MVIYNREAYNVIKLNFKTEQMKRSNVNHGRVPHSRQTHQRKNLETQDILQKTTILKGRQNNHMWAETRGCFSTEKGIYIECNLHLPGFYPEITPSLLSA